MLFTNSYNYLHNYYILYCVVNMAESKLENEMNEIEEIYKMTNSVCLIINIINFDGKEELKREGSE